MSEKLAINTWMIGGDAIGLRMKNTLDFEALTPDDDGMFTRVTGEGLMYAHRVPNQDLEKLVTNTSDIELPGSEVQIIELISDFEISAENGSFLFTCKINNGSSGKDDFVTLVLRDGSGNAIASKQFQIDKGDTGYGVTLFGAFGQDWPSGSTFRIFGYSNENSTIKGTLTPTSLKVVEAQAAPVSASAIVDKMIVFDNSIRNPNRTDIIQALNIANASNYNIHENFAMFATNGTQDWIIYYFKETDKFYINKIKEVRDN